MMASRKLDSTVAGALAGTAVTIMRFPCDRAGGCFVPTAELVQADLEGRRDPHPVLALARRLARRPPASRVLVLFDDVDVTRNWLLPPDPPLVSSLWPAARSAALAAFPDRLVEVELLSRWLRARQALAVYEDAVTDDAAVFLTSMNGPKPALETRAGAARQLMNLQIARWRRFAAGGEEREHRLRAARHLANYSVQGQMVVAASPTSYLLAGPEEADKMSVFTPGMTGLASGPDGRLAEVELVDAAIPAEYGELRQVLPLYLADLPRIPCAVKPALAADIVAAIGKLLTPETASCGADEVRALNHAIGGGHLNRRRTAELLLELLHLRHVETGIGPGAEPFGEAARKLFGHLAVRWQDSALTREHHRHLRTLDHLRDAVPDGEPVALVLTGSLTTAPGGWWHPFLSDIDVMPLRRCEPSPGQVERMKRIYENTPRRPWVYLDTGACPGVAGIDQDPQQRLFVAEHLPSLMAAELRLLGGLLDESRFLGGDRGIYDGFRAAFNAGAAQA